MKSTNYNKLNVFINFCINFFTGMTFGSYWITQTDSYKIYGSILLFLISFKVTVLLKEED